MEYSLSGNLCVMKTNGNGMCFLNAILDYIYINQIKSINPLFSGYLLYKSVIEYLGNQELEQNNYASSELGVHAINCLKLYFPTLEPVIITFQKYVSDNKISYTFEIFEDDKYTNKNTYILMYCNGSHYSLIKANPNDLSDFYMTIKSSLYEDNVLIDNDLYDIYLHRMCTA
jgi:hypothetical protein